MLRKRVKELEEKVGKQDTFIDRLYAIAACSHDFKFDGCSFWYNQPRFNFKCHKCGLDRRLMLEDLTAEQVKHIKGLGLT